MQPLSECLDLIPRSLRIARSGHISDPWHLCRLLRLSRNAKREEQSAKRDTEEFRVFTVACCLVPHACFHRITLSARKSTDGGTVSPSCWAVLRLTISSNFVGRSTGKSAGFAPFRILST